MRILYFYFGFDVGKDIKNALGENRTRILPSGEVRSIHWTTSATYILYQKQEKYQYHIWDVGKNADRTEDKVNDKDNKYIFDDDENDALEIAEYLERELDDMDAREKSRISRRDSKTRNSAVSTEKKDRNKEVRFKSGVGRGRAAGRPKIKVKPPEAKGRKLKKPKFILLYEKNKLKVLWSALGVLIVILLVALIVTSINKSDDAEKNSDKKTNLAEEHTTEGATDETTASNPEDENMFIAEPADSPYNKVCESFLKNTYVQWNDEALSQICDNTQNLAKDNYIYLNKYIEDIHDVNCYVGYETEDGKILVFVTYNMKFTNISTSAPAMEAVVMVKAQEGEGYLIHNFEVGDEMDLYTSNVQNNQNYLDLCSNINTQLSVALENDADLKKVYDVLNGAGGSQ